MSTNARIVEGAIVLGLTLGAIGWGFFRMVKQSDDPPKMLFKVAFSVVLVIASLIIAVNLSFMGPVVIITPGIVLSILWVPHIGEWLCKPLTNLFDGGREEPERKAYYSIAIARRKQGKFPEAVMEVRRQLACFPNDFEGMMLLAAIQAEDVKDLASAEITLNHFGDQPHPPPKQFAAAMNQLADWQLKLAQDADAARTALEKIIARFPDTELALLAAQRIGHLAGAEKNFLAAHDRQSVALPEGVKNIGLLKASEHLRHTGTEPETLAADYVKHLEQHPLDTEIREQLAILYADHYQRLDLATGELEQLIESPNQPARRVAHWLNLLADLQVRHGADYDTVRQTLERIVERFPDWAAAEMARSRLNRLPLEFKAHGQKQTVKLGTYEQNLGLKRGRPGRS
ncbi:MAG: tetratricopeptide repeat protein [Limisphaerales bacterium]